MGKGLHVVTGYLCKPGMGNWVRLEAVWQNEPNVTSEDEWKNLLSICLRQAPNQIGAAVMMKSVLNKSKTLPSADEISEIATRGEDVSKFFTGQFTVVKPVRQVNVDLTEGMLRELDERDQDPERKALDPITFARPRRAG